MRRAFKILPPLYIFLIVMSLAMLAFGVFPGRMILASVFFVSNYLPNPNAVGIFLGHTWSLAIEEHFYLILPLLLLFLTKKNKSPHPFRWLPLICLSVGLLCFVSRWMEPSRWSETHLRMDGLFAGATLRYMERYRAHWFRYFQNPAALLMGLTFWILPYTVTTWGPLLRTASYTWTVLSASALVGWCFSHDSARCWKSLPFRTLASIGLASYSMYLWQEPFSFIGLSPRLGYKLIGFVLCVAAGKIMAALIEFPSLKWRDRFLSRSVRTDSPPMYSAEALPAHIQS